MFGVSIQEFLVILVVALVVAGPEKIPEIARAVGDLAYKWQQAFTEVSQALKTDEALRKLEEEPFSQPRKPSSAAAPSTSAGADPGRENAPDASR